MSATNHTQNYDLSQFVGGDIPSWLNDYNGDMSKIDAAIASVAQGSGDVAADVASLKSRMTSAEADIDAAESNISTLQSTASTQGAAITQNANNITTTNNNVSALDTRVTALENASGSGLDLSAHTGTATVGNGTTGTIFANGTEVDYALNDDKSIGKLYGTITVQNMTGTGDWVTIATVSSADFKTIATSKTVNIGYASVATTGSAPNTMQLARLVYNTDGTIDVQLKASAVSLAFAWVNLPPCIYFLG